MIGTAGNLAIGISLIMRDQFSNGARRAGSELDRLQDKSKRAQMASVRDANAIGTAAGAAALMGMREWVKVGAEFDKQMVYMYSISEKKQGYTIDRMRNKAMEVGANTMFSTTEVAKSMVTMAQAGQNVEQIYQNINAVAVLAAATMSDIHSSASTMNDIMIGFNIPATEANSMRVADIITKSINDSNIQLADFGQSMKYIIPTATSLGISLEEVAAMISTIGNAGIKGSMAGTNLENLLRYLARASGAEGGSKQNEALAMLGLAPQDLIAANGELKNMSEMLPMIGGQLRKMSAHDVQGFNAMMDILGVRGGRAGNLLAQNFEGFQKFLTNANNSGGAAQKTADDVMGSLWGNSEQLESTWENLKIVFTEAIRPVLVPLIKGLTWLVNLLRKATQTNVGKWLTAIGASLIFLRTGVMAYKTIVLSIGLMHGRMGTQFMGAAGQVSAGYNQMTAAANRYNFAMRSGGILGTGIGAGLINRMSMLGSPQSMKGVNNPAVYMGRNGQYYSQSTGSRIPKEVGERWASIYGSSIRNEARFGGLARAGNMVGKYAPWAAIAGMGLQLGSEAVGPESGAGRAMGVAGSTIGWAGTGAMLGSVVPGVGTLAGAIVGGVGGLLYSLYSDMKTEEERLKEAKSMKDQIKAQNNGFDPIQWRRDAEAYLSMGEGDSTITKGFNNSRGIGTNAAGANMWLQGGGMYSPGRDRPNRITINIDGKQAMDRVVKDQEYNTFVNLGF
jgi:TP901 family phage tail tape measure protein